MAITALCISLSIITGDMIHSANYSPHKFRTRDFYASRDVYTTQRRILAAISRSGLSAQSVSTSSTGHLAAMSLAALNTMMCHAAAVSASATASQTAAQVIGQLVTTESSGKNKRGMRASTMAAKLSSWGSPACTKPVPPHALLPLRCAPALVVVHSTCCAVIVPLSRRIRVAAGCLCVNNSDTQTAGLSIQQAGHRYNLLLSNCRRPLTNLFCPRHGPTDAYQFNC